jgi:mannosylglycerate hydrolase
VAVPDRVIAESLAGFAARLTEACDGATLPDVRGELRDSAGWTWSLQGTFATRAQQKRTNAHVERILVREAEPWSALAWFCGLAPAMQQSLGAAWRTLLATHPHDTLCGCSHDDVARAAEARWAEARQQGEAVRDDAIRALVQCDVATHRDLEAHWRPTLVLRNPAPRARGGAVELRLLDASVPDPVGPGSAARSGARVPALVTRPEWSGEDLLQLVRRTRAFDRVESPQHYPRNAVVRVSTMMAWIDPMPGFSVGTVALAELASVVRAVPLGQRVRGSETELAGPAWRLATTVQGVAATHRATGARLAALGWLESTTDAGDTYTPSLRGTPMLAQWSAPDLRARGPLRATWDCAAALTRPQSSVSPATDPIARELTQGAQVAVSATMSVSLDAGADRIDITIRGENAAGDHRLRWVLPLPASLHRDRLTADAAFGPVERAASVGDARVWPAEMRLPTAPLHRWVWLTGDAYGLAVISDGLAEYELTPDGHLAITLVRAVGELSRRDLPERPGHAGWPLATPDAQSLGAFEARFSIVALPTDRIASLTQLEATADDVLVPIVGDTWRGVATPLPAFPGLSLDGDGLVVSAIKESEDGEWLVLRCINPHAVPMAGAWQLPREMSEARTARLDETPDALIAVSGARLEFVAGAHAIVTLLVR